MTAVRTLEAPDAAEGSVPASAYVALALVILFFSGALKGGEFAFFDYSTLAGAFGKIGEGIFVGQGGTGAKNGFLYALSLVPGIMLALAAVEAAEGLRALEAAQRLMTPLLRPLIGIPGAAGLALISSLQSSDAGAAMTKELSDKKLITNREKSVFAAFQFSSASSVTVYLSIGSALFGIMSVPHMTPLAVIFFYKIVGANLMRAYLEYIGKEDK